MSPRTLRRRAAEPWYHNRAFGTTRLTSRRRRFAQMDVLVMAAQITGGVAHDLPAAADPEKREDARDDQVRPSRSSAEHARGGDHDSDVADRVVARTDPHGAPVRIATPV